MIKARSFVLIVPLALAVGCSGDMNPDASDASTDIARTDVVADHAMMDTGTPDTGSVDTGTPDTGAPDSGPMVDAETPDSGEMDTGVVDAGTPDTGPADTGTLDTGPEDAGPADTGPADTGPADAGPADAGPADSGPADGGSVLCPSVISTIDCSSGTISGNTSGGSTAIDSYTCGGSTGVYAGAENVYRFMNAGAAEVTIVATRGTSTSDFDLMVLDGSGDCTSTTTCTTSSRGVGTTETVHFDTTAGQPFFVAYDVYNNASSTTDYTLQVTCVPVVCGDGTMNGAEECDDGNTANGDGCSSTCQIEIICGDGTMNGAEECDDGNTTSGDGCSSTCQIEIVCGDGAITGPEECDDSNTASGDGCSSTCHLEGGTPIAAAGGSITLTGTLETTDPTYSRATASCGTHSGTVYYDTFVITNTGTTARTIRLTAMWTGDGYLFVYRSPFDPTMPLRNCVVGDDDFGTNGSQITNVTIGPGESRYVIATQFGTGALGDYSIVVDDSP
jgi:cysteine-rich repeat protein